MDDEIAALVLQLADPQYSARKVAARKLERLGEEAAPALRSALDSRNPVVVTHAARLLGLCADLESVEALTRLLYSTTNADIQNATREALQALTRHQTSQEAIARIQQAQNDARQRLERPHNAPERADATLRPLAPAAPPSARQVRQRATLGLPESLPALVALLGHSDYQKRIAASAALVERGEEAVEALCGALESPSVVVRRRAAEALGQIGSPSALAPLLSLLRRETERLSDEAGVALATRNAITALTNVRWSRPYTLDEAIALVRIYPRLAIAGIPSWLPASGARRLKELAARCPGPELRAALPHLKGRWPFVPREFVEARTAIAEATKAWADLPIASTDTTTSAQNLPRPAEPTEGTNEDLPHPSKGVP